MNAAILQDKSHSSLSELDSIRDEKFVNLKKISDRDCKAGKQVF